MIEQKKSISNKVGVFFLASLVLFITILVFTYLQSITSFEDLLRSTIDEIAVDTGKKIAQVYPTIEQESVIISRNRALKHLFLKDSDDVKILSEVKVFIDWFIQNASVTYSTIGYLSQSGKLLFDSDRNVSESNLSLSSSSSIQSEQLEVARNLSVNSKNLSVFIDSISTGQRFVFISRSLKMRKIGGTVIGAIPLEELIDLDLNENTFITVTDRNSGKLIYNANPDVSLLDLNMMLTQERFLVSEYEIDTPQWKITIFLDSKPYLEEPKTSGRITLIVSLVFVLICATIIRNLLKRIQNHNKKMEAELATAHNMQMGLMPKESPDLNGFRISGFCRPATEVGGDFFQYYPMENGRLSIAMADVTGHGMEAAIPTVLFSGILDNQMESAVAPEDLFGRLNRSLCRNLDARTFVCCTFGEINPEESSMRVVNGGCPYPYHFKNSTQSTEEIILDALPLGLREKSQYEISDRKLEKGDRVVFCSDGIVEVHDESENMFGFDRTRDTINRLSANNLTANEIVNGILEEVDSFRGSADQDDDQTIVVVEVL
jgi:serine phosphatase RsbU (regulator of sigma subunit)